MADYNSSLPIRTETDGDVVSKIIGADGLYQAVVSVDGELTVLDEAVLNALSDGTQVTKISDGTDTLAINADGSINASFAPGTEVKITDGTETALVDTGGQLLVVDSGAITELQTVVTQQTDKSQYTKITNGTDDLVINGSGSINAVIEGVATVLLQDGDGDPLEINTNGEALVKDTDTLAKLTAIEAGFDIGAYVINITDGADNLGINPGGSINVEVNSLPDHDFGVTDGTDTLAINTDGSINVVVQDAIAGAEVHEYGTTSAGAPNTPSTVVDYTVTVGKTLQLKAVGVACSGKAKFEIKTGPASSEVTKAVGFLSTANGFAEVVFPQPIEVEATHKVLVLVTNRDNANADLYAFINGNEI